MGLARSARHRRTKHSALLRGQVSEKAGIPGMALGNTLRQLTGPYRQQVEQAVVALYTAEHIRRAVATVRHSTFWHGEGVAIRKRVLQV